MANELFALRGMLGLCQRAGRLQSGTDAAVAAIRGGTCFLALVDAGAAENTKKKITDACIYCHVPYLVLPAGLLESATGKEGRMTAAVTEAGFAARLRAMEAEGSDDSAASHKQKPTQVKKSGGASVE